MTKKITVYTVLIVLAVALVFANAYAISLAVWRLGGSVEDPIALTSLNETGRKDSDEFGEFNVPENAEYFNVYCGLVKVGEKTSFVVQSDGVDVSVEIYCVDAFSSAYYKDKSFQNNVEYCLSAEGRTIFNSCKIYEDGTAEFKRTEGNKDVFMIIKGGDVKSVMNGLV